jgi:serine/threonine protein kinase
MTKLRGNVSVDRAVPNASDEIVSPEVSLAQFSKRYTIESELARGAFGTVYRAWDGVRRQQIAIKAASVASGDALYAIKREFRMRAEIHHPHLLVLHELYVTESSVFFTMDLVHGATLEDHLSQFERGSREWVAALTTVVKQLLLALQALHDRGVVHRDVKPQNVLITRQNRAILLDFSLAGWTARHQPDGAQDAESMAGTPIYMAPEQFFGGTPSPGLDLYSLGTLVYEALTARCPFARADEAALVRCKLEESPPPIAAKIVALAPLLCSLTSSWLSRAPELRASSAVALTMLGANTTDTLRKPSFIERSAEAEMFSRALAQGQGVVIVSGESGVGKTTFVQHCLENAPQPRPLLLSARCYPTEHVPFNAIDGWIDGIASHLLSRPNAVCDLVALRDLATAFPHLSRAVPGIVSAEREGFRMLPRIRRALVKTLQQLMSNQRVVLWTDDLQWVDQDSLSFIEAVATARPTVTLVLSYREPITQALRETLERLRQQASVVSMELLGLRTSQVINLSELMGHTVSEHWVMSAIEQTGGNVFLLTQLLKHRTAEPIPAHLLLSSSLDALSPDALQVLHYMAIATEPLPTALVSRMRADGVLELLCGTLLKPTTSGNQYCLELPHDRLRLLLREQLDPEHARSLHADLLHELEQSSVSSAVMLAYHSAGAGLRSESAHWYEAAGDEAALRLAWSGASAHYTSALGQQDIASAPLLRKLATAVGHAGRPRQAVDAWLEASRLSGADDDVVRAAEHLFAMGEVASGLALLHPISLAFDLTLPVTQYQNVGHALWWRMRVRLRGLSFHPRAELKVPAHLRRRADMCWAVGGALGVADAASSFALQSRHLYEALETGVPNRIARALAVELVHARALGNRPRYLARIAGALDAVETDCHDDSIHAFISLCRGHSHFLVGELNEAAAELSVARAGYGRLKTSRWEVELLARTSLWVASQRGDHNAFRNSLEEALESVREGQDRLMWTQLVLFEVQVALTQDDPARARERITASLRGSPNPTAFASDFLRERASLQLELYSGARVSAIQRLSKLRSKWRWVKRYLHVRLELDWFEAIARLGTPHAESDRFAARCVRRLDAEDNPWSRAMAMAVRAARSSGAGRSETAAQQYAGAGEQFSKCGLDVHATMARLQQAAALGETQALDRAEKELRRLGVMNPVAYVQSNMPGPYGRR